jgi:hypothetical protein
MDISAFDVKLASPPQASAPEFRPDTCVFQCLGLRLVGSAKLGNSPSPRKLQPVLPPEKYPIGMGWRIGLVQVNVQEWCWALYRAGGRDEAVLQEWPTYTMLDTAGDSGRDIFCSIQKPLYQELSDSIPGYVEFVDIPINEFQLKLGAAAGNGTLCAIGLRLSLVCALAARAPDDALYVLQWVPWYVQWSYDFVAGTPRPTATKLPMGTKAAAGPVQVGCPQVLAQALADFRGRSANVVASAPPRSSILRGALIQSRLQALRARG